MGLMQTRRDLSASALNAECMNMISSPHFLVLAAYLIGSVPFGYLVGKVFGRIDIREHGSRNIGATNVGRVMGSKWGILVLLLDLLKGLLPVGVLSRIVLSANDPDLVHWQVAAGVATIVGHMFPCWLRFRGGKGVATSLGVVMCLAPWATLAAVVVFALTFGTSRIVSLASILASLAFAIVELGTRYVNLFSAEQWSLTVFSILVPLLIIVRHRANIVRLWRGEEARFRANEEARPPTDEVP